MYIVLKGHAKITPLSQNRPKDKVMFYGLQEISKIVATWDKQDKPNNDGALVQSKRDFSAWDKRDKKDTWVLN